MRVVNRHRDIKLLVKTELNELYDFDFYTNYLYFQGNAIKEKKKPCAVSDQFEKHLAHFLLKSEFPGTKERIAKELLSRQGCVV